MLNSARDLGKIFRRAFTLIEMLVVLAIIAMLAAMLTVVMLHARSVARQVQCQENERQIGSAINSLAMANGGLYPNLTDAYPVAQPTDADPGHPNNSGFPWWARVFQQWDDLGSLFAKDAAGIYLTSGPGDADFNPRGHVLNKHGANKPDADTAIEVPLPKTMDFLHCPVAKRFQPTSVKDLFTSISYGLSFDVKDADSKVYYATPPDPIPDDYSARFPASLTSADKAPDDFRMTEIRKAGEFILLSEANVGDLNNQYTGGRIAVQAADAGGFNRLHPARIVGRHGGRANVLFADMHVAAMEAAGSGAAKNVNLNTSMWTLPGE